MDETKYSMTLKVAERGGTFTLLLPKSFCEERKIRKGDWLSVEFQKLKKV